MILCNNRRCTRGSTTQGRAQGSTTWGCTLKEVLEEVQLEEVQPDEVVQLKEFLGGVLDEVQLTEVPKEVLADVLKEVLDEVQLEDSRTYSSVYSKKYATEYSLRKYSKKQRPVSPRTKEGGEGHGKGQGDDVPLAACSPFCGRRRRRSRWRTSPLPLSYPRSSPYPSVY